VTMKVSLITTVLDASDEVGAFLESVSWQTRPPDEFLVVDGGSTDGTLEQLRSADAVTLLEEPGANVAHGRNVAISAATHDVIAVTDADCVLERDWLERLLDPLESGSDVSMGFYRPLAESFLQRAIGCVTLPEPEELDEATFMPSGRSVAFTRQAIGRAGGYPEWLETGEDLYVHHRFRDLGLDMRLARDAIVNWPLRRTLAETWRQYFGYARGDAIAGIDAERHALRFGAYAAALYAWSTKGRGGKLAALAAAGATSAAPIRRALNRFEDPAERARAIVAVPALIAFIDAAKMAGYLAGLRHRADRADRRGALVDPT
jgi:glycosyltransferase involved in cell wall biosynthesis